MKISGWVCTIILMVFMISSCQQQSQTHDLVSNGKVLSGSYEGNEIMIAMGDEDEKFVEAIDAFNELDIDGLWKHMADTVEFHNYEGQVMPLTKQDMGGMFSSMDSVNWDVMSVIPVRVEGSEYVDVFVESHETFYPKEGPQSEIQLVEKFTFKDGKVVKINQWMAKVAGE